MFSPSAGIRRLAGCTDNMKEEPQAPRSLHSQEMTSQMPWPWEELTQELLGTALHLKSLTSLRFRITEFSPGRWSSISNFLNLPSFLFWWDCTWMFCLSTSSAISLNKFFPCCILAASMIGVVVHWAYDHGFGYNSIGCFFIPLVVAFALKNLFSLMYNSSKYLFLLLVPVILFVILKNSLSMHILRISSPMFSPRNFTVSCYI